MSRKRFTLWGAGALVAAVTAFSACPAPAPAGSCLRNADCDAASVCIDGGCVASGEGEGEGEGEGQPGGEGEGEGQPVGEGEGEGQPVGEGEGEGEGEGQPIDDTLRLTLPGLVGGSATQTSATFTVRARLGFPAATPQQSTTFTVSSP